MRNNSCANTNAFEYYEQMRKQQLFYNKLMNPETCVPSHVAFSPIKPKIQQFRLKQRIKKQQAVDSQNMTIMKKLFSINSRKPQMSHSTPNIHAGLPSIQKKPFAIPQHENENNIIARKLITSKSSINVKNQLKEYRTQEKRRNSLRRFSLVGGQYVDKRKLVAQLMLMKKLRVNENTQSRVFPNLNASRVSKSQLQKVKQTKQENLKNLVSMDSVTLKRRQQLNSQKNQAYNPKEYFSNK